MVLQYANGLYAFADIVGVRWKDHEPVVAQSWAIRGEGPAPPASVNHGHHDRVTVHGPAVAHVARVKANGLCRGGRGHERADGEVHEGTDRKCFPHTDDFPASRLARQGIRAGLIDNAD